MQLRDLGELKTIELIKKLTSSQQHKLVPSSFVKIGIGDDAAVLKDDTVITTDAYLESVHFSLNYFNFYQIGQRVVCATLSDIAAMTAQPLAVFVSALLPPYLEQKQLKELYSGMQSVTSNFSCEIAGGDIVAYPKLGLILTAVGKTKNAKLRSTAKVGEYLYISGYCGLSETGRLALKNNLPVKKFIQSIKRHTCPVPRINEAVKLKKSINAMIDTSDGLSTDVYHIAEESKVKIIIFAEKIPIHKETNACCLFSANRAINIALNGGEDYELLFTSDKNLLTRNLGVKITQIGKVEKGNGVFLIKGNKEIPLLPQGYNHFTKKRKAATDLS